MEPRQMPHPSDRRKPVQQCKVLHSVSRRARTRVHEVQSNPVVPGDRVTLADVASRAGVSTATASRTLRGVSKVASSTRQRVLEAARDLSYITAMEAFGGEPGRRQTVAIIAPFVHRSYFGTVMSAATDRFRSHGYDVLLYHLGTAEARDSFFSRMPLAGRVDGVLSLSMPLTDQHTLSLRSLGMPLVSLGPEIPGSPSVGIDDVGAARGAVRHLLNLGHRRIALIQGTAEEADFDFVSSGLRQQGFEEALESAELQPDPRLMVSGPHSVEGGAAAMAELLGGPVLPTAVFADHSEVAIGALWALRKAGLRVPEDVSVIGIDDHEMAPVLDLTTVAQDVPGQAVVAARLLMRMLCTDGEPADTDPIIMPTRLILRRSTAPLASPRPAASE